MFGIDPDVPPEQKADFDPLNNDYIEIKAYRWMESPDYVNKIPGKPVYFKPSPDYELEPCSEKAFTDLIVPAMRYFHHNALCFKHPEKLVFSGNYALESNINIYVGIFAC